jgi:hypothetical protein
MGAEAAGFTPPATSPKGRISAPKPPRLRKMGGG